MGSPPRDDGTPHTYTCENECNFVLKGELTCDVGGEIVVAPVGSYVLKPRNVPHTLCNTGTEPVWVIEILTPGGFEGYFDEYEKIVSKLASGEIDEEEHRRAGRAWRALWGDLARRAHPQGQSPLRHRALEPHRGADYDVLVLCDFGCSYPYSPECVEGVVCELRE